MGLSIASLTKSYPNTIGGRYLALNDINLEVGTGTFLTLLGPSGCGKSTLLNLIAGLDRPSGGAISINGRTVYDAARNLFVPPAERNIAMVFQSYAIWPHMTVRENVEFPLRYGANRVRDRAQLTAQAAEALEKVRLSEFADRPAPLLSGGQQQRVSLARALAQKPSILLLDEPLSNLDASLREEMQKEIRSIVSGEGMTAVYVTHDQKEALSMSDVIAVMREGKVEQIGTPQEIYFHPRNRFVAEFLGSSNLVEAKVEHVDSATGRILTDTILGKICIERKAGRPVSPGQDLTLVLKQEDLRIINGGSTNGAPINLLALPVTKKAFYGSRMEIMCMKDGLSISIYTNARDAVDADTITVSCAPDTIHYF